MVLTERVTANESPTLSRYWVSQFSNGRYQHFAFFICAFLVISFVILTPTQVTGDAQEYLLMTQAWFDHGSPDLRGTETPHVNAIIKPYDLLITHPYHGFFKGHNGRWYCWHFWVYPLFVIPMKALLHWLGVGEFHAFKWSNLILFLIACYVTLFHSSLPPSKRWMLVGIAAITPVLWYVNWVHPESFSWSLVLLAVAFTSNRRYWAAALCAAIASTQNPPLLFLTLYIVLLSLRERNWRTTGAAVLAAFPFLIPPVFYYLNFGSPNLIVREGFSSLRFVSWYRFWSFFFDLNQGLLPYVPVLLLLAGIAVIHSVKHHQWHTLSIGGLLIAMILSAAMTRDWISAMAGMQRYTIWMLPVFAWFIVEALPDTPVLRRAVLLAVAIQGLIVVTSKNHNNALSIRWPARIVWNYAPAQYNPVYIIFAQRVTGTFYGPAMHPPIGYVTPSGEVTKILADSKSLAKFPLKYAHVDRQWLQQVKREYGQVKGQFYLHPPRGAVRSTAHAPK